jgi:hypothetical protein
MAYKTACVRKISCHHNPSSGLIRVTDRKFVREVITGFRQNKFANLLSRLVTMIYQIALTCDSENTTSFRSVERQF